MLEARVKLAELGLTVAEVQARGVEVAPDWQGDMSVSVEDGAPVHAEIQAATVAHEALWAAHVAAGRAWQADRSAAIAEAGEAAGRAERDGSHGARLGATQTAGTEAAKHFERTVPRPLWSGKPSLRFEYIDEGDAPGVIRRAVRRVRGEEVPA